MGIVIFIALALALAPPPPAPDAPRTGPRRVFMSLEGGMIVGAVTRTTWELVQSGTTATLTAVAERGTPCPPRAAQDPLAEVPCMSLDTSLDDLAKMYWTETARTVRRGTWTETPEDARLVFDDHVGRLECTRDVVLARPRGTLPGLRAVPRPSKSTEACSSAIRWTRSRTQRVPGWACELVVPSPPRPEPDHPYTGDARASDVTTGSPFFADRGSVELLVENSDCMGQGRTFRLGDAP